MQEKNFKKIKKKYKNCNYAKCCYFVKHKN